MKSSKAIVMAVALGSVLMLAATGLPLWSRYGVDVNGWEGDYFSPGRWILVGVAVGAMVLALLPKVRQPFWLAMMGLVGLLQAGLVGWQGWKLHAIGFGVGVMALGGVFILVGAVLAWRMRSRER